MTTSAARPGSTTAGVAAGSAVDQPVDQPVDGWTLELVGTAAGVTVPDPVAAALRAPLEVLVPGSVHTALIAAGLAGDVAGDGTEAAARWISRSRWRYTTTLAARPGRDGERAALEFLGIDTFATITVNGRERLRTADMHRTHRLDVTDELAAGPVRITVELEPALEHAERADAADPLPRPGAYVQAYNQVRKMACSFGWDWGPSTVTAGLWRPVRLRTWRRVRLADVRVAAALAGGPRLDVTVVLEAAPDAIGTGRLVRVRVLDRDGVELAGSDTPAGDPISSLPVPSARAWYPVGLGDQPLYDVLVELVEPDGEVLDSCRRRVGFRDVALLQTPDVEGSGISFELHVNGQRVWVRGLNWIPDDPFPERVDAARVSTRIGQAVDAGANLLRVWGGGIFESEEFYDACDAAGVLVWQDFLFACAAYPEDDATMAEVSAEVSDNVRRLRHRASLAIWCGCNESLEGHEDWGWQDELAGRPWGAGYYYRLLPEALAELDGTRPYVPGSPFSPDDRRSNAPDAGTMHIWDVWNELDYTAYEQRRPRFAAEFGYQAPASWPTLVTAVTPSGGPATLTAQDPRLAPHQKAYLGDQNLRNGLLRHLRRQPQDGPGWYFATQLLQARAVSTGIDHFRSLHDHCSGTIWWQLNDCWPAVSWSVVDVAGRRKLAWYALRRSYAPRLAVLGGDRGDARLTLVNDTGQVWSGQVTLSALTATGAPRGTAEHAVQVPAHGHLELPVQRLLGGPIAADADLLVVDHPFGRATRWLVPDLELALDPGFELLVSPSGPDQVRLDVSSAGVLRDVAVLAEITHPDAVIDDQLRTALPGERISFTVRADGAGRLSAEQWRDLVWHHGRLG